MEDILNIPAGRFFNAERQAGKLRLGDDASLFANALKPEELTFDVSNLRVLGNMGEMGQLKAVTIYRDSYKHCADPNGVLPGVWTAKDLSSYGPYFFTLELERPTGKRETIALDSKLKWDYRIVLLDNIFPLAELKDPAEQLKVRLLTFAPISADGTDRPAGLVYHLWLENTGSTPANGTVKMPNRFGNRPKGSMAWNEPYEFEVDLLEKPSGKSATEIIHDGLPFSLKPGEKLSVPFVFYMSGSPAVEEIQRLGEGAWFKSTWEYYRRLLGRLEVPSNPWLAEFYERQLLQSIGSLALGPSGKLAGSNWGSYPATRQIWTKDCFYSALPIISMDPSIAPVILDWFHENGMRQPGSIVEGGAAHSISLTVSSLMLAGKYWENTGDAGFFRARPDLRQQWEQRLEALEASRRFPDIQLYPTRFISDGAIRGDFHCGSNIAVWHALTSYARLLTEVYNDPESAARYEQRAAKLKADLLKHTVIEGKFGPQFIELINRDGKVPRMASDGEESETTLIPYYGFLPGDDTTYLNYMRFSMSPENAQYTAALRAIDWGAKVPSTAPGYMKGLSAGTDAESLFGEHGYYTEVRRVTDADGSLWWWPVTLQKPNEQAAEARLEDGKVEADKKNAADMQTVARRHPGKAGWFAGVHSVVFRNRFAGIEFDAPKRLLTVRPHPALGEFSWTDLPFGNERFTVSYASTTASFENPNDRPITVQAMLSAPAGVEVLVNGKPCEKVRPVTYLGRESIEATFDLPAKGKAIVKIAK